MTRPAGVANEFTERAKVASADLDEPGRTEVLIIGQAVDAALESMRELVRVVESILGPAN